MLNEFFRDENGKKNLRILEPIMTIEIITDKQYCGSIMNDISSGRRGNVLSMNVVNMEYVISAEAPLKELIGYSSQLRSMTSGNSHFYMEFARYDLVNSMEQEVITKEIFGY
jgi:elongation factor G